MSSVLVILLAIIPGLLIGYLIYRSDLYEKESPLPLLICFGLGIISAIPALKLEEWGDRMGIQEGQNFWMLLLLAFVVVALSEELMKFIVLVAYPFQRSFFNEPMDGIIYSGMIGMGFATIENIFYATQFGTGTTIVRAFTAVPAHGVFAIIMGYYVGLAKMDEKKRVKYLVKGLGIAVLVHGTYDFFILQHYRDWLMIMATFVLFISGFYAYRLIRKHQSNSPFIPLATAADPPTATDLTDAENEIKDDIFKQLEEEDE
jgi:RsiW-degrading membrane proteinase PrsW (M82 family)